MSMPIFLQPPRSPLYSNTTLMIAATLRLSIYLPATKASIVAQTRLSSMLPSTLLIN